MSSHNRYEEPNVSKGSTTTHRAGKPLHLYLTVSENAMSSALVQEVDGDEKPVYFVSKDFKEQ
ncbi:hypothetical protein A2U01_0041618, partial [Trifolium medium]|nr:hypothetical protein [Trifolium medium]